MAKYKVIATSMIPLDLRPYVDSVVSKTLHPNAAMAIAGSEEWTFKSIDHLGRAYAMTYRGIEVALFFKRAVIAVDSEPCDPLPECSVDDIETVWVRVELMHCKPSKHRGTWVTSELEQLRDANVHLQGLCKSQQTELDAVHKRIAIIENRRNPVIKDKPKIKLPVKNVRKKRIFLIGKKKVVMNKKQATKHLEKIRRKRAGI